MDRAIGSDFRYTLRVLRRSPGFTAVAVLSLAVGIGANTSMFGVVRAALLQPLPAVESPEELSLVTWRRAAEIRVSQMMSTDYPDPRTGEPLRSNFSYPMYRALRDNAPAGVELFAFNFLRHMSVAVDDAPALLAGGALADGRYFPALGVGMRMGRGLTEADDRAGAPLVVVLSHSFWMRSFGGDPDVLGRSVRINGQSAEVVGVTAEGFDGLTSGGFFPETEVTVPLAAQPVVYSRMSAGSGESLFDQADIFWLRVMARVSPGVPVGRLESAFSATFAAQPSSANEGEGAPAIVRLIPGSRGAQPMRDTNARFLVILMGLVGIVLLITCVNLAGLMLARGVHRRREMAVRRALGGGRTRLIRQTLLECLILAGLGAAAGLVLTFWARGFLVSMVRSTTGVTALGSFEAGLDGTVLLVSAGIGVIVTFAFGLFPALRASDVDPMTWLKHRAGAGTPRLRAGRVLLALQIAVSVPLLVGAILFLRTLSNLGAVDPGFRAQGMAMFQVDPGFTQRPAEEYHLLYRDVLTAVEAVPGVTSATLIENGLMTGIVSNTNVEVAGEEHRLLMNAVGPGFLETTGMRLIAGRAPSALDHPGSPHVAAVNEAAVREVFGGQSPVGLTVTLFRREVQIVGVVSDALYSRQRNDVRPTLYDGAFQRGGFGGHYVVFRSTVPLSSLELPIRRAVADVDRDLPVPEIRSQIAQMEQTTARERVFTRLLVVFGSFALLLASIGLHGVTAYSVARRTSEIGVRVAVGARPPQVLWLMLRQVFVLAGTGLVIGVPVAVAAGPIVGSLLYGVAPNDIRVIAAAAILMLVVALAAGFLPAWRAARLDALTALGTE